jgi:hypothetical protein
MRVDVCSIFADAGVDYKPPTTKTDLHATAVAPKSGAYFDTPLGPSGVEKYMPTATEDQEDALQRSMVQSCVVYVQVLRCAPASVCPLLVDDSFVCETHFLACDSPPRVYCV